MNEVLEKISAIGIVPVIKIDDVEKAVPLAKALCDGGIPCAEVTFRTEQAAEAMTRITKEFPDMLVGAGTVLTTTQVDQAVKAGAKFIVSPGLNPKIVSYCLEKGIPVTPGCANPSDIECALELGLDVVKFFPAEALGGIKTIKAVAAPYNKLRFMPTGGVNAGNINDYLSFDKIIACGGSWMVKADLINEGKFDEITALCREAMQTVLGLELAHIGINCADASESEAVAKKFSALFGIPYKAGNSSNFAGSMIECMKEPFLGKNGHIAIKTNYIKRAVNYFESQGFTFRHDLCKKDANGNFKAIYFTDEIGGFAIHLVQK